AGRVEGLGGEEMRQAPQGGHAALPGRRQHRLVLVERRGEVAGEQRVPADEEVIVRASKGAQPWKIPTQLGQRRRRRDAVAGRQGGGGGFADQRVAERLHAAGTAEGE